MDYLTFIAEQKIAQALEKGELKPTLWKNRPLPLVDDHLVPDDLKMAYKMLKNAGYLPPEVETRKEISRIEQLIAQTEDEHVRIKQMKKLSVLLMKVDNARGKPSNIAHQDDYYRKVVEATTLHSQQQDKRQSPAKKTSPLPLDK